MYVVLIYNSSSGRRSSTSVCFMDCFTEFLTWDTFSGFENLAVLFSISACPANCCFCSCFPAS